MTVNVKNLPFNPQLTTPTWSDSPEFWTITSGPPDISFCSRVEEVSLHLIMEQNKLRPRIHVPESPGAADTPSDFAHSISFVILPSVPTKRFLQAWFVRACIVAVCISIAGMMSGSLLVSPQPKTSKFWPLAGTSRLRFNLTGAISVICCPTGRKIKATSFPSNTSPL